MASAIRIAVIEGSVKENSNTGKATALVLDELEKAGADVQHVRPRDLRLQLPGMAGDSDADQLVEAVEGATGVILATPEYHGTFSAAMKLVIENLGFPSRLAGKPVSLLGVAAGVIGAIKALEHLRSVCSHVGAIVLPGPVSVARVNEVFDADGRCTDPGIEKLVRSLATNHLEYIHHNICPRFHLEQFVRAAE